MDVPASIPPTVPDASRLHHEVAHPARRKRRLPELPPSGYLSISALALIVAAFGVYYFVVAQNRETYLSSRELRQLRVTRDKTTAVLTGFTAAANTWIDRITDSSRYKEFFDRTVVTALSGSATSSAPDRIVRRPKDIHIGGVNNELWLTYRDTVMSTHGKSVKEFGKRIALPLPGDPDALADLFDIIMITDSSGNVLYENDIAGLSVSVTNLDSLLTRRGDPFPLDLATRFTSVSGVDLAGMSFKAFSQPLPIPSSLHAEKSPWLLLGLIRADRFRSQCLKLPYDSLIFFVFLILLALLTWPLLKVGFMSVSEELKPGEVFLMVLASLIGSALVTALFADFFCIQISLTGESNADLRSLAGSVESQFRSELDSALVQLRLFAGAINEPGTEKDSLRTSILDHDDTRAVISAYPALNSLYLIDSTGMQVAKWTTQKRATPLIQLRQRKYFQDIVQGHMFQTRTGPGEPVNFTLEPHLSMTTGEFETSIATPVRMPAGTLGVACLTTGPRSLYQPTVMHDFAFCIIDAHGNVLYHSDASRNLSENLFEECDQDADLLAAVSTRTSALTRVAYWGESCVLYVKPIADIPWFVVAIQKQTAMKTANLEILTVMMILFLVYAIILLAVLMLFSLPRGWQVEWIWPIDKQKDDYLRLMFLYLFICFVSLYVRTSDASADHLMIVTTILPFVSIALTFLVLKKGRNADHPDRYPTAALTGAAIVAAALAIVTLFRPAVGFPWLLGAAAFIFGIIVVRSKRLMDFLRKEWLRCLVFWVILYIVATLLPLEILPFWRPVRSLTGLAIGVALGLVGWRATAALRGKAIPDFRVLYAMAATAFLWFAAVQPALTFFKIACDTQLELIVKHNQLHLAEDLGDRRERFVIRYDRHPSNQDAPGRRSRDTVGLYTGFFLNTRIPADGGDVYTIERGFTDSVVIPTLMPHYDEISTHVRAMMPSSSADTLWRWATDASNSRLSFFAYDLASRGTTRDKVTMSTTLPTYLRQIRMLPIASWVLLVVTMFGLLLGLFYLVRYIIQRVFMVDAVDTSFAGTPAQILDLRNRAIIVLGASPDDKADTLHEGRTTYIDPMTTRSPETWTRQVLAAPGAAVVIDNLDLMLQDASLQREGLLFLEDLVFTQHRKTLAFSATEPLKIPPTSPTGTPHGNDVENDGPIDRDRWSILLNAFFRTRFAAGRKTADFNQRLNARFADLERELGLSRNLGALKEFVKEECGEDPNIQFLALMVLDELADDQIRERGKDEFVRALLEYARPYYHQAWKICSREQRRVLVHLARNGFVNAKARSYVEQLFRVGLVCRNPALKPMNRTFRSFILEIRQPADTAVLPYEARKSTWGLLRIPLTILLVGVAAFLIATQHDVMDSTTALLTAAAGLVPALMKLLGLFRPEERTSTGDA